MGYKSVSPLPIAEGGTNATSMATTDGVAYFDGTSIVTTAVGTAGQVLTSNGAGVAPTFQGSGGGGATSLAGDSGGALTGALTLTGGTSGSFYTGSGTTLTRSFNYLALPNSTSSSTGYIKWTGATSFFIHNYNAGANFLAGVTTFNTANLTGSDCAGFGNLLNNAVASRVTSIGAASSSPNFGTSTSQSDITIVGAGVIAGSTTTICTSFGSFPRPSTGAPGNNCLLGPSIGTGTAYSRSIAISTGVIGNPVNNSIKIGSNSHTTGTSNCIQIGASGTGNNQQNQCFIGGINGITVTGAAVLVSTADKLGVAASSERFKSDIQNMGTTQLLKLRPVTFLWNKESAPSLKNASSERQYGLIAEEVNESMPQLVVKDSENKPFSVHYRDLSVLILNEIKKLKQQLYEIKLKKGVL